MYESMLCDTIRKIMLLMRHWYFFLALSFLFLLYHFVLSDYLEPHRILEIFSDFFLPILIALFCLLFFSFFSYFFLKIEERRRSTPILEAELMTKNQAQKETELFTVLVGLGAYHIKRMPGFLCAYQFEFPFDHKFDFIDKVNVMITKKGMVKFDVSLAEDYPCVINVRKRIKSSNVGEIEIVIEPLEHIYIITTTSRRLANLLFSNKSIQKRFLDFSKSLEIFALNYKYYNVQVRDISFIPHIFEIIYEFSKIFQTFDFTAEDIDYIKCYNCGEKLEAQDTTCPKCNTPRSTCMICLLPLNPHEKKNVVETPCCKVYAHKEHIMAWISRTHTCPNCQHNLGYWLRELQKKEERR